MIWFQSTEYFYERKIVCCFAFFEWIASMHCKFPQIQRVRSMRFGHIASLFFDATFSFHIFNIFVQFISLFFFLYHYLTSIFQAQAQTQIYSLAQKELNGKSVNSFIFHANNIKQLNSKLMIKRPTHRTKERKKKKPKDVYRLHRYLYLKT